MEFAEYMEKRSGFHRGQIDGILTEMVDAIRSLLSIGQPVTIEGLGTFHTSLTSPGFERPEQVTPGKVSVSRVYFVACPEFSREVKKMKCMRIPCTRQILYTESDLSVFWVHHTIILFFLPMLNRLSFSLHKALPSFILLSFFVYTRVLFDTRVSTPLRPGCQTYQHPGVSAHETRVSDKCWLQQN